MAKVALVTGAASGIGQACLRRFRLGGFKVAAIDVVKPDDSEDVFWGEPTDISNARAVAVSVEQIVEAVGPLDVLVHAAGISGSPALTHETSEDELNRMLDVNLKGAIFMTQSVLKSMIPRRSGAIVHISSVAGLEIVPGNMPYSAAKAGLINATRSMAWEYGRCGIRINCICPGLIRTPMTKFIFADDEYLHQMTHWAALRRAGEPEEIASVAEFLASEAASFITGQALAVDGGWTAGRDQVPPRGSD